MFKPVYQISNKLLSGLLSLERARAVVEIVPVPTEWEGRLKQDCLTRRVYYSLKLYGSAMSAPDISKIIADEPGRDEKAEEVAKRLDLVAGERDLQSVLNFLNANRYKEQLGYLSMRFQQSGFGEKDLNQLNSLLMEKIAPAKNLGVFRMEDRAEKLVQGRIEVPLAVEVSYQSEDFFNWFASSSPEVINPVLKAGVLFYEIARIQPFDSASLLTGILFTNLFLVSEGYDLKGYLVFEEELLKNKEVLLSRLALPESSNGDMTGWLEFFCDNLAEAGAKVKAKLMSLVGDKPMFRARDGKAIPLTERQIAIMEELTLKGETTIKELRTILPSVSEDTILRDLKDLIDKKLVKKKGKTRGARYQLGKAKYLR